MTQWSGESQRHAAGPGLTRSSRVRSAVRPASDWVILKLVTASQDELTLGRIVVNYSQDIRKQRRNTLYLIKNHRAAIKCEKSLRIVSR